MITREEILKFSEGFIRTNGCSPTLREIAKVYGVAVTTIRYHLSVLHVEGLIVGDLKRARGWTLPKFLDAIQRVKP